MLQCYVGVALPTYAVRSKIEKFEKFEEFEKIENLRNSRNRRIEKVENKNTSLLPEEDESADPSGAKMNCSIDYMIKLKKEERREREKGIDSEKRRKEGRDV